MWLRAPRVHPEGIGEALRVADVFGDIQEMIQACPLLGTRRTRAGGRMA